MARHPIAYLTLAAALSTSMGCQKVIAVIRGLTGGSSNDTSTTQPANNGNNSNGGNDESGSPSGPPSSVRTPAPSVATGCPATVANAALLPGTIHNHDITRDETWTLEGSPHRLPDGAAVQNGATVTLAPCAVVLVGHGNGVEVQDGAGLIATGDPAHPIRFGSDNPQPQAGDWQSLWFSPNARRTSRLSNVILEHGGADWNGRSACLAVLASELHVDHVTARQCRAFGVGLFESGTFSRDSSDLTVTGAAAGNSSATGAVYVQRAPSVASVPSGAYTGNAADEVFIAEANAGNDQNTIRQSAVWKNLGVPYHLADDQDLRVDGPTGPVLTISPGVTIRFGRGAGISVGYDAEGGLVLDGNAEATRITLRPAGTDESPAQWRGIYLGPRFNRSATRLRFATLRNAGQSWNGQLCDWEGTSSDDPFVMFEAAPNAGSVDHLTFAAGPPNGVAIGRKWAGAPMNFNASEFGNDFSQFGNGCHQSPQPDANNACPDPAPRCE